MGFGGWVGLFVCLQLYWPNVLVCIQGGRNVERWTKKTKTLVQCLVNGLEKVYKMKGKGFGVFCVFLESWEIIINDQELSHYVELLANAYLKLKRQALDDGIFGESQEEWD
eukprot:TRINITY_DN5284_c0_g1_i6.p2 TRINITY_DN5284_c0_g1~~TRINITY_DN5284_c0_g1_i6.p2  ORF type:complete len:111 (-),score=13.48 TRINITY_DN5284_c0_g1_i6:21-353(-)